MEHVNNSNKHDNKDKSKYKNVKMYSKNNVKKK